MNKVSDKKKKGLLRDIQTGKLTIGQVMGYFASEGASDEEWNKFYQNLVIINGSSPN